jgi:hypothetical protein
VDPLPSGLGHSMAIQEDRGSFLRGEKEVNHGPNVKVQESKTRDNEHISKSSLHKMKRIPVMLVIKLEKQASPTATKRR